MSDQWYPRAEEYWVPDEQVTEYPIRYGDLFVTPANQACVTSSGKPWRHTLVLHPSCELGAKANDDTRVLVARVNAVTDIGSSQRSRVRTGWNEKDGQLFIAHANTFWMPTYPGQDSDEVDWYADFRRLVSIPLAQLTQARRVAALTHEARIYLLRREIYYKYRWLLSIEDVRRAESNRISNDENFEGPKPIWARE